MTVPLNNQPTVRFVGTTAAIVLGVLIALSIAALARTEYGRYELWATHQAKIMQEDDQMRADAKDGKFYSNCLAAHTYAKSGGYREVSQAETQECFQLMSDGIERNINCYAHLHRLSKEDVTHAFAEGVVSNKAHAITNGVAVGGFNDSSGPTEYVSVMSEHGYKDCMVR